jgi:hypothetical protein
LNTGATILVLAAMISLSELKDDGDDGEVVVMARYVNSLLATVVAVIVLFVTLILRLD